MTASLSHWFCPKFFVIKNNSFQISKPTAAEPLPSLCREFSIDHFHHCQASRSKFSKEPAIDSCGKEAVIATISSL